MKLVKANSETEKGGRHLEGKERRAKIFEDISKAEDSITGAALAKKYGVSRQVIVQDIALLRASGCRVMSTAEGYMTSGDDELTCKRVFAVKHNKEEIEEELNLIVDNGGNVLNVIVSHPVYGEIGVDMMIANRRGVKSFVEKLRLDSSVPLMNLTKGEHLHVVEAVNEEALDDIENALKQKGFLL